MKSFSGFFLQLFSRRRKSSGLFMTTPLVQALWRCCLKVLYIIAFQVAYVKIVYRRHLLAPRDVIAPLISSIVRALFSSLALTPLRLCSSSPSLVPL